MKKMFFLLFCLGLAVTLCSCNYTFSEDVVSDIEFDAPVKAEGTHKSGDMIKIPLGDQNVEIQTFCVDQKGRLFVSSGGSQFAYKSNPDGTYEIEQVETPSSIHVFSPDGKSEAVWKIEVTPQALAIGPDGSVYAAGMGKIVKLDPTGKVLETIESPHVKALPPLPPLPEDDPEETKEVKETKKKRLKEIQDELQPIFKKLNQNYLDTQKAQQAKDEDAVIKLQSEQEKLVEQYMPLIEEQQKLQLTKKMIAMQERNAVIQAKSVKSIAVTKKYIFVCTPPAKGYASEVWRLDLDFKNPKVIVQNLSGCCGQMNISAVGDSLVVPENARKKVHFYDADGNRTASWGEDESTNAESGFGSCCNPMNVTFDKDGNVLTSEASVGAIKRFTQDGKFIELIAQSKIVPGCKHTPIGLSPDGNTAYMLDQTQKFIIVLKKPA